MRAGYSMFAVQYGGWCAASATAPKTFVTSMESLHFAAQTVKVEIWQIKFTCLSVDQLLAHVETSLSPRHNLDEIRV